MDRNKRKELARAKRKLRVRKKIFGTPGKPRLSVFRSLKHIYCQVIDDSAARTLVASSTKELIKRNELEKGGNIAAAERIGKDIAKKALEKGIQKVVFDRGCHKFHGRVKALAEKAREGGISF